MAPPIPELPEPEDSFWVPVLDTRWGKEGFMRMFDPTTGKYKDDDHIPAALKDMDADSPMARNIAHGTKFFMNEQKNQTREGEDWEGKLRNAPFTHNATPGVSEEQAVANARALVQERVQERVRESMARGTWNIHLSPRR